MENRQCQNCRQYLFVLSLLFSFFSLSTDAKDVPWVYLGTQCQTYSYTSDTIRFFSDSIISCSYSINGGAKHKALKFTSIEAGHQTFNSNVVVNHLPKLGRDTSNLLLYLTFPQGDTILHQQMVFQEPRLLVLAIGANTNPLLKNDDSLHYASLDAIRMGKELDAINVTGANVTSLIAENGRVFTKQDILKACDRLNNDPSYREPVIVYLAGHGEFVINSDSKIFKFYIGDNYTIDNNDILDILEKFVKNDRTVYLIIDACESQYAIQKTDYEIKFAGESIPKTVLFYAASYKHSAKEDKGDSIGVFTREFLNAIHSRNYTAFAINRYMKSHYESKSTTELFVNKGNQSLDNELKEHLLVKPQLRPFLNLHYTWSPLFSHGIALSYIVSEKVPICIGITGSIGNQRGNKFVEESCFSPSIGTTNVAKYYVLFSGGIDIGYRLNDYISIFIGSSYSQIRNVPYSHWETKEYVASTKYPLWTIHPSVHLHLPTKSPYINGMSFRFGYHFLLSKYDGTSISSNIADPQMFTHQLYKSIGFLELGLGYTFKVKK